LNELIDGALRHAAMRPSLERVAREEAEWRAARDGALARISHHLGERCAARRACGLVNPCPLRSSTVWGGLLSCASVISRHSLACEPTVPAGTSPRHAPQNNPSILSEAVDELIAEAWLEVDGREARAQSFALDLLVASVAFSQGKYDPGPQVGRGEAYWGGRASRVATRGPRARGEDVHVSLTRQLTPR
jgi:hypothetical protein